MTRDRTCHELADQLSACLDGELEGACLDDVLRHLEACPICAHCLQEIKATRELLKKIPAPDMPQDLKDRLKACVKKTPRP